MQVECECKPENRHEYDIISVIYHSPYVYTGSHDGKIKVWKENNLSLVSETLGVQEPGYGVYCLTLAKKANLLFSCGNDGQWRAWKLPDLKLAKNQPMVNATEHELWKIHCDEKTSRVYTLDDRGIVFVYDMNDYRCIGEILGMEQLTDVTAVGDCIFTVRNLDVTCVELVPSTSGYFRSATRATLLGRVPLCLITGDNPSIAYATRDGRSIEVRSSDKTKRFKKTCDITNASDKLINAIVADKSNKKKIYTGGWDQKISSWDISEENGKLIGQPVQLSHVINDFAVFSKAIYAGGPSGFLTKVKIG